MSASERVIVENNALGDKDKNFRYIDLRPGWLKPGAVDVDGDIQGNGMLKASIVKVPPKTTDFYKPCLGICYHAELSK